MSSGGSTVWSYRCVNKCLARCRDSKGRDPVSPLIGKGYTRLDIKILITSHLVYCAVVKTSKKP